MEIVFLILYLKKMMVYMIMNKGLDATGDVVGILNSDDFYYNNHVISDVEVFTLMM